MDILKELEKCRSMITILNNWEKNIEYERQTVIYGTGKRYDDIKVQTTRKHDAMENKIIAYQGLEEKKADLFIQFLDKRKSLNRIVFEYCKEAKYIDVIYKYFFAGESIDNIPKCTNNTLKKAVQHIQYNYDLKEETEELIQNAIK